ncbi:GNAT family N-acetyltransferase [Novosphingobium sp. PS1R-30]|uniref:GNAT family N-acetyltransferase n=1 Tax=Novosphingobium anseongense TaxID=3133436 RepID=A0ABU8RU64_9SPHN
MEDRFCIRPVNEGDLPLLTSWRQNAHVRQWWGPPEIEPEAEKLQEGRVAMWIVLAAKRPIAFIQDYVVTDWSPHHFDYLPPGSRGMDLYVGEEDAVGRGHGTKIVRQHVDHLFAMGVPAVGIDPHPDNDRARRAFTKAGFSTVDGPLNTRWGRAILMHRFRPAKCSPCGSGELQTSTSQFS